jgi:predicted dehydrogenase
MSDKKVNIAIIGLGFGAEFIPIYQKHPNANMYAICQRNEDSLNQVGDAFGIDKRYTSYEELLADSNVDAVHINTPIHLHAEHSLMALRAGKHVSCTVPMATTIADCEEIVDTVKQTGLKYTMAETVVYSREYLFVKELYEKGELGEIQYLQASHQQDMDGWPSYWEKMIPMHYATHVVSPCLALTGALPDAVCACVGGGSNAIGSYHAFLDDETVRLYGFEAGGDGLETGRHAACLIGGSPGVLHGGHTYVMQDADGQTVESHSISAGLDYPSVGPEHAWLHDTGRATYRAVTDTDAMAAFELLSRTEGIIPAIESAHALAGAQQIIPELTAELGRPPVVIVTLSGRGDKDMETAGNWFGLLGAGSDQ